MEEKFAKQLEAMPGEPGVYIFKEGAKVLYVGKAAILRNRVRSYFGSPRSLESKVRSLMERVTDLEYIVTDSEQEAFILENTLIKRHKPFFNIRLKDDKNYPYLKLNVAEDWARLYITRRVEDDGARYFGPFASAGSVRKTMELVHRLFPLRPCTKTITPNEPRPCLEFYINRCNGPCAGLVSKEEYSDVVKQVVLFLEGKRERVLRHLSREMEKASEALNFERAAVLRDQVHALERLGEPQKVVLVGMGNMDIIAIAREKNEGMAEVFFVRGGKVIGREGFALEGVQGEEDSRVMTSFVRQFYDSAPEIPPRLLLQSAVEEPAAVEEWLARKRGRPASIRVPLRGEKRDMVQMVAKNAEEQLQQQRVRWLADRNKTAQALVQLQEELDLPDLPQRIECYDISNIQGTNSVGSMVVFENGTPKPAHYRRFQIKTVVGADDFASLQEVLRRRFKRFLSQDGARRADDSFGVMPDLVLIDGGKGQLNAAMDVLLDLGEQMPQVASIAKENEEIYLPDVSEPVVLPRDSQGLYLVQRIRDEAHRFAVTYHRKLRGKRSIVSALDRVPGIGPKRKKALIQRFGSFQGVKEATIDEIAAVPGMTAKLAKQLKDAVG